jgi:hypothetical protein
VKPFSGNFGKLRRASAAERGHLLRHEGEVFPVGEAPRRRSPARFGRARPPALSVAAHLLGPNAARTRESGASE